VKSLFTRPVEDRALSYADVWGAGENPSVTADGVLRLGAVYAAVSLIADQFAAVPLSVVRRVGESEEPVETPYVLTNPDINVSLVDWTFQAVASLKLRGNAYGLCSKEQGADGVRLRIEWLHPDRVAINESDPARPRYTVDGKPVFTLAQGGDLIHVREFVQPGSVVGLSPIAQFMDTFDTASQAQGFGRRWFKKAAVPPAILQSLTPRMPAAQLAEARDDFVTASAEGKPVALPGEWKYERISIPPNEAQFLETIKASATQIAAIFRVPPEDVGGESGGSRTYGNREADAERFNARVLLPLATRMAAALGEVLADPSKRIRYDLDSLARPGQLEMARADTEALRNGTLSLAEARRAHGRRPLTDMEVEQWQQWYTTTKSESESTAESISTAIVTDGKA